MPEGIVSGGDTLEKDEKIRIEVKDTMTRVTFVNDGDEDEDEMGNGDHKSQQNNPLLLSRLNTEVRMPTLSHGDGETMYNMNIFADKWIPLRGKILLISSKLELQRG